MREVSREGNAVTRHHYNAEAWTNPDGSIDFGASVPFGAQFRHRIAVEKRTGWHVQCYRADHDAHLGIEEYKCDTLGIAIAAFTLTVNSGHFRYITLTDLSTNTIIKDHSTKDTWRH